MTAVTLLQGLLFLGWGDPRPIYDEAGYLAAGEAAARWLRCISSLDGLCTETARSSVGRLLWHNPGYATLFVVAELLPGNAANWIRGIQLIGGLLAGVCVYKTLQSSCSPGIALSAAWIVWLHPVQLFFRVTLWPVALATAAVSVTLLLTLRVHRKPSCRRRLELSLGFLVLSLLYPLALGALPLLGLWLLRTGSPSGLAWRSLVDVLAPTIGVWAVLILVTSSALGTPSFALLAGPENEALGNNPYIAEGRGSSLHDQNSVRALRANVERMCPSSPPQSSLRCRAQAHRAIARETIALSPGRAALRAGLRVVETWSPDEYVSRHLSDDRVHTRWSLPQGLPTLVSAVEIALLIGVLLLPLGARDPRVRGLLVTLMLCTVPITLGVGITRLRQPLLPVIILAAALSLSRYHRAR